MYIQKLSDLIIRNLKFLKFDEEFYQNGVNVLQYFLEKDICSLFGKDEFTFDELSQSNELEIEKITDGNGQKIKLIFPNEKYIIQKINNALTIMDERRVLVAKITMDLNGTYQNILTTVYNDQLVFEIQRINKEAREFEYEKRVKPFVGEEKKYDFCMKSLGMKKDDVEKFELLKNIPEDGNNWFDFFKKIFISEIVSIPTSYITDDICNYLNNIFDYMEKKCENKEKETKKLVLKK